MVRSDADSGNQRGSPTEGGPARGEQNANINLQNESHRDNRDKQNPHT